MAGDDLDAIVTSIKAKRGRWRRGVEGKGFFRSFGIRGVKIPLFPGSGPGIGIA